MSCRHCWVRLVIVAAILLLIFFPVSTVIAQRPMAQYLLFQIFTGSPEPSSGIYHRGRSKEDISRIVRLIADTVRPARTDPDRILGFAIGPIAMDQGEDGARSVIRDAFDVALATDLAVALHLDDYMFWAEASWPDGRLLRAAQGTIEWKDWSETPAGELEPGYMQGIKLAPQLCYESPEVRDFTTHWTRDVIGQEIEKHVDRLVKAGKARLFAGVIVGWESNLNNGYCSLSQLGYTAQNPPADFDHERERILQRHMERWAKGIYDAGVPRHLIFTHFATIPKRDYDQLTVLRSREQIRKIPGSTAFRAFWTAFNSYSNAGFTGYPDEDRRFADIYDAVRQYGSGPWAMAEGTNAIPGPSGTASRSPLDWETYLARNFNHGAALVDIFGGFQGEAGDFQRAAESEQALAAYHKFLQGDHLVENTKR
jgi:hypothetical protein